MERANVLFKVINTLSYKFPPLYFSKEINSLTQFFLLPIYNNRKKWTVPSEKDGNRGLDGQFKPFLQCNKGLFGGKSKRERNTELMHS